MNDASAKKGFFDKIGDWFSDIIGEFRKIIWPSRKELTKQTGTVIFTSALFGAVIYVLNLVFLSSFDLFAKYLGK